MSELQALERGIRESSQALPATIAGIMRDSLKLVANTAVSRYMIATRGPRSSTRRLPGVNAPVDPTRLTWRTGNLARSLVRDDHPGHVHRIRSVGGITLAGEIGTRVNYAAIHEYGGVLPAHTMAITERMRRFFWAKWYETGDDKWKRSAMKRNPAAVSIPARTMRARPFLNPAAQDRDVEEGINQMIAKRVPMLISDRIRLAIESVRA